MAFSPSAHMRANASFTAKSNLALKHLASSTLDDANQQPPGSITARRPWVIGVKS